MKRRIAIWAIVGLLVACGWTLYAFATAPDYEIPMTLTERVIWAFAVATCPIILAGVYFIWVPPVNAVTYALIGLIVEKLRRRSQPTK